jgi:SAM-dependent methyltransferase
MNQFIDQFVGRVKKRIGKQSKVLEIGSLNMNGSIRHWFKDADEYIGIDYQEGEGVDVCMWSYDIPKVWSKGYFDCVIACESFEHDPQFWRTWKIMKWVLKKGGWMIITAPGRELHLHEYPYDFYRFMPQSFSGVFYAGFKDFTMHYGFEKDEYGKLFKEPSSIACVGRKP